MLWKVKKSNVLWQISAVLPKRGYIKNMAQEDLKNIPSNPWLEPVPSALISPNTHNNRIIQSSWWFPPLDVYHL